MTTTEPTDVHRTQAIADIRALADFLEEDPHVALPIEFSGCRHIRDPREFARAVHALGDVGLGDVGVLDVRNGYAKVTLRFGAGVELGVQTLVGELLGEQPALDQTDRVRRALADLVTREARVSADG